MANAILNCSVVICVSSVELRGKRGETRAPLLDFDRAAVPINRFARMIAQRFASNGANRAMRTARRAIANDGRTARGVWRDGPICSEVSRALIVQVFPNHNHAIMNRGSI